MMEEENGRRGRIMPLGAAGQRVRGLPADDQAAKELWLEASQLIRVEMSDVSYNTWMSELRPVMAYSSTLVLENPNAMYTNFIQERYQSLLDGAVSNAAKRQMKVELMLPAQVEELLRKRAFGAQTDKPMLNPRYTFETFVVGSSNRFAHAASLAAAELPGDAYNPLFIYGGVGLGKTHLMHAIGHHIMQNDPSMNIIYVTSETFTNELIRAIQTNKNQEFRNKFRGVDVLMVDDIQFIGGKEQTQEEFFHTFNALHEAGKQIVISSDKQPREITSLEDRLRSRFEWGLMTDIQKPDLETRIAILRRKGESEGFMVPDEVHELIAQRVESNIRELEGNLTRVCAYANLVGQPVTLTLAESALRDMLIIKDPKQIPPDAVMDMVSDYYNISRGDITGQKRNREIVRPRQMAMYLMRTVIDMSLPAIGAYFGGRDHTTVLHACNKVGREIEEDRAIRTAVEDIKKRLMEE